MQVPGWMVILVLGGLGAAHHFMQPKPVRLPPGQLVGSDPDQTAPSDTDSVVINKFRLTPVKDYDIECRVVSSQRYRWDDMSGVCPIDFAVAWGKLSDQAILDKMSFSQGDRFGNFSYKEELSISNAEIGACFSNMHLIPIDSTVERTLFRVPPGAKVHMKGQLVNVNDANGRKWKSSVTRLDTGAGACEIMLVRSIEVSP